MLKFNYASNDHDFECNDRIVSRFKLLSITIPFHMGSNFFSYPNVYKITRQPNRPVGAMLSRLSRSQLVTNAPLRRFRAQMDFKCVFSVHKLVLSTTKDNTLDETSHFFCTSYFRNFFALLNFTQIYSIKLLV